MKIRNLAIIAHVDHGKTTLIDGLFRQAGVFKSYQKMEERVMDSGELEKERGITIRAKNASFEWKGVNINMEDGPVQGDWHAALKQSGVTVIAYIPSNAYLVYGDAASLKRLNAPNKQNS